MEGDLYLRACNCIKEPDLNFPEIQTAALQAYLQQAAPLSSVTQLQPVS